MPRAPRFAPGGHVHHALKRAVVRLPLFEKAGDFAAFQRVMVEAQARNSRQWALGRRQSRKAFRFTAYWRVPTAY